MYTPRSIVTGLLLCVVGTMTGCRGELVEVPPAYIGKVVASGGMQSGVKKPSSFRLPYEFSTRPKLILAEVSDQSKEEKMEVMMPEDNLVLRFDIRGTYAVSDDTDKLDIIFSRLTATESRDGGATSVIDFDKIYDTYAAQVIRTRSREVLTRYRIEYVLKNMDIVSGEIRDAIRVDLKNTPVDVSMLALANVQPPDVIMRAQEAAVAREIAIQQAEADKLVKLKEAEAGLEVARKQQEVELVEAETQVLVDKKLAEGVSEAWLRQRGLAVLEKLAAGDNKIIFLPMEALHNPAMLIGALAPEASGQTKK